jgi:hypothetical protein
LTAGTPGFLRYRVVNPRIYLEDGFEDVTGSTTRFWTSIGTDATGTLSYWTQDAGSWSIASNLVTAPASLSYLKGGHSDWKDVDFVLRAKWVTGGVIGALIHYTDSNNWIGAIFEGANILLQKSVAGTVTTVATTANTGVNGTFYWLRCASSGTTYHATLYNDSSGALSTERAHAGDSTISDAAVQMGYAAIRNNVQSTTYGGAFTGVCYVEKAAKGPNLWSPVVASGEPAFCQSDQSPQAGTY